MTLIGISGAFGAACGAAQAGSGELGERVSASARWHLEHRPALRRRDCSGLVTAILHHAGVRAQGSSRTYWADAEREGRVTQRPRPGDLVFFDRTYDANRNGRVDDVLTHVAVVTGLERDGTVVMVHFGSRVIRPLRMNLERPHEHRRGQTIVNDYLRAPSYPGSKRLAGELFRGFARPPTR